MLSYAEIVSTFALIIAFISLLITFDIRFQDRPRLKISARFILESDHGPNRVKISMVNLGRRPVIIKFLGGTTENGNPWREFIESDKGGLRLGENEAYEYTIEKNDTVITFFDDVQFYESLWVQDSTGRRYYIPKSQELIRRLWS